ncbi:D-alanyl-D-alanine carboxypeptidase family protein [Oceanobacillus kimchii]|uniref:D-alanyl-D-alanine carboxypeptidase family protein n=1 Tax=Oceanobacillus kimchii TaxID=746691 RepID=UPI003B02BE32
MRVFIGSLTFLILIMSFPSYGQALPSVSANNAVLIEQSTGRVLFEKNANEEASIASITKIMTAIIAIESGMLDEQVTTSRKAIYTEGSSIYLEQGEEIPLKDLVYGLMLRSGNDAAVAIAEHVGGSEEGFVYLMNEKAKWLGMENTHFDNPHGLDSDTHYSSAYDMAILMKYAMDDPMFREVSGSDSYLSENRTYHWQNKNKLLTRLYNYCTGGKTGYTKATGRTLVTSAHKNGMDLIAVTLDAPDDWQDHISMFEWGFDQFEMKTIQEEGTALYHIEPKTSTVYGNYKNAVNLPLLKDGNEKVDVKNYFLSEEKSELKQAIGKSVYYINNQEVYESYIYPGEQQKKDSIFDNLKTVFESIIGREAI